MSNTNNLPDLPGMKEGKMSFPVAPWLVWDIAAVVTGGIMILLIPMERWQQISLILWDLGMAALGTVTVLLVQSLEKNEKAKATATASTVASSSQG